MPARRKTPKEPEGNSSAFGAIQILPATNAGRPKEGLDSLPADWKDQIVTMYANGASDVEIKATIYGWRGSFSNDLWDRWMLEETEFSETIKIGRIIAEAWYTRLGREQLKSAAFPFVGWYMQMKNRFGWKDKQEVEQVGPTGGVERKSIQFPDGTKIEL